MTAMLVLALSDIDSEVIRVNTHIDRWTEGLVRQYDKPVFL
jgi:hypothetical protein